MRVVAHTAAVSTDTDGDSVRLTAWERDEDGSVTKEATIALTRQQAVGIATRLLRAAEDPAGHRLGWYVQREEETP